MHVIEQCRNHRDFALDCVIDEKLEYSVVITSKDRPVILGDTVRSVLRQVHPPQRIILVLDDPSNAAALPEDERIQTIFCASSNSAKRNLGMDFAPATSLLILFLDDDVELHREYALMACRLFATHGEILAASGEVLLDAWIPRKNAEALLGRQKIPELSLTCNGPHWVLYGCNMVIRREVAREERFDEALPLYSFGEDYELSIRVRRRGVVCRFSTGLLVHLKTPSSRLNRKCLAWSIIANNWYFIRKGSTHLPRHLAYLRFAWTFFHIGHKQICLDLRERNPQFPGTRGVLLAIKHLLTGKLHPERLLELR